VLRTCHYLRVVLQALEMLEKLIGNIVANPKEPKYQKIRLTNEKIAAVVIETDGARDILEGAGFVLEGEFMVFSDEKDKSHHVIRASLTSVREALYQVKGRPAGDGEIGGQAQFGTWSGEGKIGQDEALAARVAGQGGVCAEKFEATAVDDGGDHFTIEQARDLEDALDHLREGNTHAAYAAALEMVHQLLDRISGDLENAAYRVIPSNAEFEAKTSAAEGSIRLLETVGFTLMALDGEMEYVCDLGPIVIRSMLERIEAS
jgi:hypothetical protein